MSDVLSSEWLPPQSFPRPVGGKGEIAIDLETCDPNMEKFGPGWPRKDGFIVGYAIAVDGWCGYYPIAHEGGGNLDKRIVEMWIADILKLPCPKIMHNAAYDLGWLLASGFEVNGDIIDTMIAAGLVDENRFSYALNSLGFDMLKEVKSEEALKKAAADFGVHPKKEMWKLPAMYVGAYGEQDAALTLKLWHHLQVLMRQEEVESIFELERKLLPVLVGTTYKGMRFDRDKAERLIEELRDNEKKLIKDINKEAGVPVDIWAAASIAKAFDELGIEYPREKGAPSFTRSFLEGCDHKVAKAIVAAREVNKTHNTFLQPYLDASEADGRIHSHINQLRGDGGGTVTGRLSMAQPNLQQVPARHPVADRTHGPRIVLPEEGELWAANDFSSQEPRLLVHYASLLQLDGAEKMATAYREDPDTDFHQMVADMAGITRKQAKTIGLGLMYGMGKRKLSEQLDLSLEEASELIQTFHERVPPQGYRPLSTEKDRTPGLWGRPYARCWAGSAAFLCGSHSSGASTKPCRMRRLTPSTVPGLSEP